MIHGRDALAHLDVETAVLLAYIHQSTSNTFVYGVELVRMLREPDLTTRYFDRLIELELRFDVDVGCRDGV